MPHADLLFTNARVFTADSSNPTAEAVAVSGGRIVFVGSDADAAAWRGPSTRVVEAGGRTLMPGFIDSHFHMLLGALELDGAQFEHIWTYEQAAVLIRSYAAEHPADAWIPGYGLRYNLGPNHVPLTRQHLDTILPDRPLILFAYDGHTAWANTRALELAGILHGGEAGVNSEIVMAEDGTASGELREPGAFDHVSKLLPKADEVRKRALLHKALRLTASLGVTSVHNMDGNAEQAALYAALEDAGELTARIYIPYSVSPETPVESLEKEALALKQNFQTEMVRGGAVKFFIDGVIEGYTGLLVEPYADRPDTSGAANYETTHYNRMVAEADRLGLQTFTHATGDLGVRRVLDACEAAAVANGKRDSRHRVEHAEMVHPADLPRFEQLGVIASMQPFHAPATIDSGDIWPFRVGQERWSRSFAWQSLREAGARLAFGSDWPVVTQNPLKGIHNALNRHPWAEGLPHHHQTLTDALLSYTLDAAYAEFQEDVKGQLKVGYYADLVLLSDDIFAIPPEQLENVSPLMTVVGGRVVYEV